MSFSDIFDPITRELDQKRTQLINDQIESESTKVINNWTEAVNIRAMEAEQNGEIGIGYTEKQKQWYDQEYSKILSGIKDKRIRTNFEQGSAGLSLTFGLANRQKEISFLKDKEIKDVNNDINYQIGSMGSIQDSASLMMHFRNVLLPNINRKIDSTMDPDLQESLRQKYATSFGSYVDNALSLLKDDVNTGKLNEESYKVQLDELLQYTTKNPDFYKNQDSGNFAKIVSTLKTKINSATEDFKDIGDARLLQNLEGNKQSAITNGEELPPDYIDAVVSATPAEKRELMRMNLEGFNKAMPYYQAKNNADLNGMMNTVATIKAELIKASEQKYPGAKLEILQSALAEVMKDYKATAKLATENYYDFIRNTPEVRAAEALSDISPEGNGVIIDAVLTVAKKNNEDPAFIEFLPSEKVDAYVSQLNRPEATSTEVRVMIDNLLQTWDRPYEGGNVATNVIRQVGEKLGSSGMAAFDYYDDLKTFEVFWNSGKMSKEDKTKLYQGLPNGFKNKIQDGVNSKLKDFLTTLPTLEQRNAYSALGQDVAAYVLAKGDVKNKKGETVDSLGKALNYVKDEMLKDKYSIVKEGDQKLVRVPKEVRGQNYEFAAEIIADPGFKQSVIDWFQYQNPDIKLQGDIVDQMVLTPEAKEKLKGINQEKLLESFLIRTSSDGMGIELMAYLSDEPEPVLLKGIGPASISFNTIQSHRAFVAPFEAGQTSIFTRTSEKLNKQEKGRSEARNLIKEEAQKKKIFNESTTFDTVNADDITNQALDLTQESESVTENLKTLDAEMAEMEQVMKDIFK